MPEGAGPTTLPQGLCLCGSSGDVFVMHSAVLVDCRMADVGSRCWVYAALNDAHDAVLGCEQYMQQSVTSCCFGLGGSQHVRFGADCYLFFVIVGMALLLFSWQCHHVLLPRYLLVSSCTSLHPTDS